MAGAVAAAEQLNRLRLPPLVSSTAPGRPFAATVEALVERGLLRFLGAVSVALPFAVAGFSTLCRCHQAPRLAGRPPGSQASGSAADRSGDLVSLVPLAARGNGPGR